MLGEGVYIRKVMLIKITEQQKSEVQKELQEKLERGHNIFVKIVNLIMQNFKNSQIVKKHRINNIFPIKNCIFVPYTSYYALK